MPPTTSTRTYTKPKIKLTIKKSKKKAIYNLQEEEQARRKEWDHKHRYQHKARYKDHPNTQFFQLLLMILTNQLLTAQHYLLIMQAKNPQKIATQNIKLSM